MNYRFRLIADHDVKASRWAVKLYFHETCLSLDSQSEAWLLAMLHYPSLYFFDTHLT
jgi:hypothetical protein